MKKRDIKKTGAFDFNKEIVFGEIGAILSAPLTGLLFSQFTKNPSIISGAAVGGSIVGASGIWLFTRIYDKKKRNEYSAKSMLKDIAYFTPAAFILTMLFYYPTLFFLSRQFIDNQNMIPLAVFMAQMVAFGLFLSMINIYRIGLIKYFSKRL